MAEVSRRIPTRIPWWRGRTLLVFGGPAMVPSTAGRVDSLKTTLFALCDLVRRCVDQAGEDAQPKHRRGGASVVFIVRVGVANGPGLETAGGRDGRRPGCRR